MILNEEKMLKLSGLLKEASSNSEDWKKYYESDYIRVYTISMDYGIDTGTVGILKVDISWFEPVGYARGIDLNKNGESEMKKLFPNYDIDYHWKFISKSEYNKYIQRYQKQIDGIKEMMKLAFKNPKKFK